MKNPRPARPYRKGECANPNGRPKKGQSWAELLREEGEKPGTADGLRTKKQVVCALMYKRAAEGDMQAAKMIMERTDGQAIQRVDIQERPSIRIEVAGDEHDSPAPDTA